jgi:hypothetical protein
MASIKDLKSGDRFSRLTAVRYVTGVRGKRGSPVASALGGNATSAVLTARKYS